MTPVAEAVFYQAPIDWDTGFDLKRAVRTKALITGSRSWHDKGVIRAAIIDNHVSEVVHGGCPLRNIAPKGHMPIWASADALADQIARELKLPVTAYPADWHRHGLRAGLIRNAEMLQAERPDIVLAFWDGVSHGTQHMINLARKQGYRVKIFRGQLH